MRVIAACVAGCLLLASGQAQHPPVYPPTADAEPSIRHDVIVAMPTRLTVERTPNRISVGFDLTSTEGVKVTLGDRMTIGVKYEIRVWGEGEPRPVESNAGAGMAGPVNPSDPRFMKNWTDVMNRAQGGIPAPGRNYVIEYDVTVFETDIPAQHFWSPTSSKKYKVLWEGKVQSVSAGQ